MRYLNGKYLIACSGGPDSMALLDMCHKKGLDIRVCHLNYHKRDSANRDERIVKKYCKENNIPLNIIDASDVSKTKGNFQENARKKRYFCFKELCQKYNLKAVLVAHHFDDLLETYLLQKRHGGNFSYYGLARKVNIMSVEVIRPLLNKTKKELEEYCENNNIPYGIDESNYSLIYERNKIRKELKEYSDKDKKKLYKEIKKENELKERIDKETLKFINKRTIFKKKEFLNFKYHKNVLRILIKNNLSEKYLDEIIKKIKTNKNIRLLIDDKYLVSEYDYIEIFKEPIFKEVIIKDMNNIYRKYDYFKISKKGNSKEGVTVSKEDFPLCIRPYKENDQIKLLYGTKKINRFFIDNKISFHNRLTWPMILNRKNELILVPGIGCNISHYSIKHNIFVVKLDNTEE